MSPIPRLALQVFLWRDEKHFPSAGSFTVTRSRSGCAPRRCCATSSSVRPSCLSGFTPRSVGKGLASNHFQFDMSCGSAVRADFDYAQDGACSSLVPRGLYFGEGPAPSGLHIWADFSSALRLGGQDGACLSLVR